MYKSEVDGQCYCKGYHFGGYGWYCWGCHICVGLLVCIIVGALIVFVLGQLSFLFRICKIFLMTIDFSGVIVRIRINNLNFESRTKKGCFGITLCCTSSSSICCCCKKKESDIYPEGFVMEEKPEKF